jgi:hypothetical protein
MSEFTNHATRFSLTPPTIQGWYVKLAVPAIDFDKVLYAKLAPGVNEMEGHALIGTSRRLLVTRNDIIGDRDRIGHVTFRIAFTAPDDPATVTIHRTGSVLIWSTGPYKRVIQFLHDHYLPLVGVKVDIVSISGRFNIDRQIDLPGLFDEISAKVPKTLRVLGQAPSNARGFSSLLHLKWIDPAVDFNIYDNGTIRFSGLKKESDKGIPATVFKSLFEKYKCTLSNALIMNERLNKPKVPVARNKAHLQTHKLNMHRPRVENANPWNAVKNKHYVRPGPNGRPRFYEVPANVSLVRKKVIKAYAALGRNIPKNVREKLQIGENNKAEPAAGPSANGPANFEARKNGFYVAPGPSFRPTWYKVPKDKVTGKGTVVSRYKKARVVIPAHIQAMFDITNAPSSPNAVHYVVNKNKDGFYRIGGKQIKRHTVAALVKIAHHMDLPSASAKMTREQLEQLIVKHSNGKRRHATNVVIGNVSYTFLMNGTVKRNYATPFMGEKKKTRTRQFATLSLAEQMKLAKTYFSKNNFTNYKKLAIGNRGIAFMAEKRARANGAKAKPATPNRNSNSNNNINANYLRNLENTMKEK